MQHTITLRTLGIDPAGGPAPLWYPFLTGDITIRGDFASGNVWLNGAPVPLQPSLTLRNHSPTGFSWGYGGSGPAQLALALLLQLGADPEKALACYQDFKWAVTARLPQEDFVFRPIQSTGDPA